MTNEKRLIDGNAYIKEHCKNCDWPKHGLCPHPQDNVVMCYAVKLVNEAPTIDAVEVVRCKDCRGKNGGVTRPEGRCLCERTSRWVWDDDFCSYGERRTDNG